MRTDGQTGMTKQIFAFCYFANSPNKGGTSYCYKGCFASTTISSALSAANASVYQDIWTSSSMKPTTGFRGLQHASSVYRELSGTSNAVEKPRTIPHACDTRRLPTRACSGGYNRPMEGT